MNTFWFSVFHNCWFYLEGHDEVNITIEIKPDSTPEVAETFTVNLVNVSNLDRLQKGAVSKATITATSFLTH